MVIHSHKSILYIIYKSTCDPKPNEWVLATKNVTYMKEVNLFLVETYKNQMEQAIEIKTAHIKIKLQITDKNITLLC